MLEVVWLESLGRIFGSTARAAAGTLAAFFLGLGVGAWLGGRLAGRTDRPLRLYGWMETLVAAGAVLSLLLLPLEDGLYALVTAGAHGVLRDGLRLLLAFVVLLPATAALGTTWPLLVEEQARRGREKARAGALLQAANVVGAAAGALLAGFVLPPLLGLRRTLLVAAGASALVGLAAILLGGRRSPSTHEPTGVGPPVRGGAQALALLSGFLGFGLQVLFVRAFSQALPASIQVFALILGVWLLALAAGSLLARGLLARPWRSERVLAALLATGGVLAAGAILLLLSLTDGLRPPPPDLDWGAYLAGIAGDALVVLVPPVACLGAVFPYLLRTVEGAPAGRAAGILLSWNTVGAIAGALLAGFLLLPGPGLWTSIRLLALLATLAALVLAWGRNVVTFWASAAVIAVAATLASATPIVRLGEGETLADVWEGSAGTVAVVEEDGILRLVEDNVFTLGGSNDSRWEALQAHIPLIIHPDPRKVFVIGMGTGITAGAVLDHDVESVEVAELVPDVVRAAAAYFAPYSNGLFEDPRVGIIEDDGRHRLRHSAERYDVVIGDLFFPWQPGCAYLYTKEHLETVRDHLAPGGHFAQWLPCYQLGPEELEGILETFVEVFPLVTLWRGDFFVGRPILAVVGHERSTPLDGDATVAAARRLAVGDGFDLARDARTMPFHFYVGNLTEAREALAGARPLTDDLPWIQWTAPRSERAHRLPHPPVAVGDTLLALETAIRDAAPADADPYLAALGDARRRYVRAGLALRRMAVALAASRRVAHGRALRDYCGLVPADERPPFTSWLP